MLCRKKFKKNEVAKFKNVIEQEYRVHWTLDSLPVFVRSSEQGFITRGYPVGFQVPIPGESKKRNHYLFNHVRIIVRHHDDATGEEYTGSRIVGFEVIPMSIKHAYDATVPFDTKTVKLHTCGGAVPAANKDGTSNFQPIEADGEEVIFTYDVKFEESELVW